MRVEFTKPAKIEGRAYFKGEIATVEDGIGAVLVRVGTAFREGDAPPEIRSRDPRGRKETRAFGPDGELIQDAYA